MKTKELVLGAFLFLLAQSLAWYQTNGQFVSEWFKNNPLLVSAIMGVPIGMGYIYGTNYIVNAFDGYLWPARILGFVTGIVSFTTLTYLHLKEGITIKTAVILGLASIIVLLQVFWKIND